MKRLLAALLLLLVAFSASAHHKRGHRFYFDIPRYVDCTWVVDTIIEVEIIRLELRREELWLPEDEKMYLHLKKIRRVRCLEARLEIQHLSHRG